MRVNLGFMGSRGVQFELCFHEFVVFDGLGDQILCFMYIYPKSQFFGGVGDPSKIDNRVKTDLNLGFRSSFWSFGEIVTCPIRWERSPDLKIRFFIILGSTKKTKFRPKFHDRQKMFLLTVPP